MTSQEYVDMVKVRYEEASNPTKAAEMSAYMRNLFPYLGINKPERANINKTLLLLVKDIVNEDFLEKTLILCWEKDEREYQYFAMDLLQKYFSHLSPNMINTLTTIAMKKSWWDSIDTLATKIVSKLVAKFPKLKEIIDEYSVHENLWLRRIAIIYQIPFKKKTDEKRLFQYCLYNAQDKDFFIRKSNWLGFKGLYQKQPTSSDRLCEQARGYTFAT